MSSDKPSKRVKEKRSTAKRVKGWASGLGSSITGGGRRGPQAEQQSAGGAALSSTAANGASAASQHGGGYYAAARIDLPSTLSSFGGPPASFSVDRQLHATYSQHEPAAARAVRDELVKRREQTSEELKSYVTRHYPAFIASTHELLTIEQDMAALTSSLAHFSSQLSHLAAPHFSTADDRLYRKQKEREAQQVGERERAVRDQLALEEWNEDLRGWIYERKFDKAVRSIERMWDRLDSKKSAQASGAVEAEMEKRVSQLVDTLTAELKSVSLKRYERRRLINWLVRLGESDAALSIYLQHRESLLLAAIAAIKLTGELPAYVHSLSSIVFGHLAVTCKEAAALLSDDMSRHSAVIVWCQQQIGAYVARVARQTLSSHSHLSVVGDSLRTAFACCASIESQGLSFSYQLADAFAPPLIDCIAAHFRQSEQHVRDELRDEQWRVSDVWVHDTAAKRRSTRSKRALKLTPSAKALYDAIRAMLKALMPLLDPVHLPHLHEALYTPVVGGLIQLFESYLLLMASASKAGMDDMDDLQSLSIVANSFYLADDLLPRVGRQFRAHFGRVLPELRTFGTKLGQLYEALQDNYCRKRTKHWIEKVLDWQQLCADHYSNPNPIKLPPSSSSTSSSRASPAASLSSSLLVSSEWLALHDYFAVLRAIVGKCLSPLAVPVVLSACFEELLIALTRGSTAADADDGAPSGQSDYWPALARTLGYGGLMQLTRDVTYFTEAMAVYATELTERLASQLLDSALHAYCELTGQDQERGQAQDGDSDIRRAQAQHADDVRQRLAQLDGPLTVTAMHSAEQRQQQQQRQTEEDGQRQRQSRQKGDKADKQSQAKGTRTDEEKAQKTAAEQPTNGDAAGRGTRTKSKKATSKKKDEL